MESRERSDQRHEGGVEREKRDCVEERGAIVGREERWTIERYRTSGDVEGSVKREIGPGVLRVASTLF